MPNFNQLTLVGHCVRDPQYRETSGGTKVADCGIAVSHKYKTSGGEQKEETMFMDWTAFGALADIVNKYIKKGSPVLLSGRIRHEVWEAKDGSGKRSKHTMTVDTMQMLGNKGDGGARESGSSPGLSSKPQNNDFKDDDVPFLWQGRENNPI